MIRTLATKAANPDGFDRFRRAYVAECLLEAAASMPARKRREFRKFLDRLVAEDRS